MRRHFFSAHGYGLTRQAVDAHGRFDTQDLVVEGPQVCLLYESEKERDELSARLRAAKLDELPWEFVEVQSAQGRRPRREALQRTLGKISDTLGAGSAAGVVLRSHWAVLSAVLLSPFPLVLMWLLARGLSSPRIAVAE